MVRLAIAQAMPARFLINHLKNKDFHRSLARARVLITIGTGSDSEARRGQTVTIFRLVIVMLPMQWLTVQDRMRSEVKTGKGEESKHKGYG